MPRPITTLSADAQLAIAHCGDGIRVHRLLDDELCAVRTSRIAAQRDPLVAALFGSAPERALIAPNAPPRPLR